MIIKVTTDNIGIISTLNRIVDNSGVFDKKYDGVVDKVVAVYLDLIVKRHLDDLLAPEQENTVR